MNRATRFTSPFRRLQWKLTLSYTLVSTGALLVVEMLLFAILFIFIGSDLLTTVITQAVQNQLAPEAREFLIQSPPDVEGLQEWTATLVDTQTQLSVGNEPQELTTLRFGSVRLNNPGQQLYVLAPDLAVWANVPGLVSLPAETTDLMALDIADTAITMAQQGTVSVQQNDMGDRIIAVPVLAEDDNSLLGILVLTFQLPLLTSDVILPVLQAVGLTLIPFTLATALVGTIFGFLTARGLTRRIQSMSAAADAWSQGDFTVVTGAEARAGDELGELGRRLNLMAEQLQNLLQTRQELATLEERNRLARDLHDSVKQQVFAITMQLGAARSLLLNDPDEAAQHLAEAEQLAQQSQRELNGLILELRPSALENQGLAEALRTFVEDWSRRSNITADYQAQGERPLPLIVEQALFRVAQEALANVARHSLAQQATIRLIWQDSAITLTIQDDGQGFVVADQAHTGVGLTSMSERMTAVNGRLTISSKPGQGTEVVAAVNLDP